MPRRSVRNESWQVDTFSPYHFSATNTLTLATQPFLHRSYSCYSCTMRRQSEGVRVTSIVRSIERQAQQNQSVPWSDSHTDLTTQAPHGPYASKSISPPSNPFASSDDGDEIQLENLPSGRGDVPRSQTPTPRFVSERPSRSGKDIGRSLTGHTMGSRLDSDLAISEWETVAADEEFQEATKRSEKRHGRRKDADVVFHAHDILKSASPNAPSKQRRNTILVSPSLSLHQIQDSASHAMLAKDISFYSSSSIYSDLDRDECVDEDQLLDFGSHGTWRRPSKKRRVTLGLDRNPHGELMTACSKTSSSASVDRFKYDGDGYSVFLHSTAERDISQALQQAGLSDGSGTTVTHSRMPPGFDSTGNKLLRHPSFYNPAALQSA